MSGAWGVMTREEGVKLSSEFERRALPNERNVPYQYLLTHPNIKEYIYEEENFTALF